jgi:hypothetical protein
MRLASRPWSIKSLWQNQASNQNHGASVTIECAPVLDYAKQSRRSVLPHQGRYVAPFPKSLAMHLMSHATNQRKSKPNNPKPNHGLLWKLISAVIPANRP